MLTSRKNGKKMKPLNLKRAHKIVASWPKWKRELADQILRPSYPPKETKNDNDNEDSSGSSEQTA